MSFNPHELVWTKEKVALFWDFLHRTYPPKNSWSIRLGKELIGLVEKHVPIEGTTVLDYGCGFGDLMGYLLDRKVFCIGIDTSKQLSPLVEEKFKDNPFFKGVFPPDLPLALKKESIDTVFLVEVIEHISPDQFDFTLQEIYRVLKPGGHLIIEAQNQEDIKKGLCICTDCGAIFHHFEHLRSFSRDSLIDLMAGYGFKEKFCQTVILKSLKPMDRVRTLYFRLRKFLKQQVKTPHIVYIGEK